MTVTETVDVSTGLYVPFRTGRRAGWNGSQPVGTVSLDAEATGDSGGGKVSLSVSMPRFVFGFHPIWMITQIECLDNLAVAEVVFFRYVATGNERLQGNLGEAQLAVRHAAAANNVALFTIGGVPIEPDQLVAADVVLVEWSTNTDAKTYHLHVFGYLFDAEEIARGDGMIGERLAGLT